MSSDSPVELAPGSTFARYRIVRRLGEGGMGSVYEALHPTFTKKRVALKLLHPSYLEDEVVVTRFLREGEAASRIRHPNVVDVYDVGTEDGVPYLVMEYLDGESLADVIARERRLSIERTCDVMLSVCAAVMTAHDAKIIHRDLKPENIFIARIADGGTCVKVVDFGISKMGSESAALRVTKASSFIGTPYYVSPEQARGASDVTDKSDQFSLGVVLYECITGKLPFDGETFLQVMFRISTGELAKPSSIVADLPVELETTILHALARDPAQRFSSVRDLGRALLPFASKRERALWEDSFATSGSRADPLASTTPEAVSPGEREARWASLRGTVADASADKARPAPRSWRAAAIGLALGAALTAVIGYSLIRSQTTQGDRPRRSTSSDAATRGAARAGSAHPRAPNGVGVPVVAQDPRGRAIEPDAGAAVPAIGAEPERSRRLRRGRRRSSGRSAEHTPVLGRNQSPILPPPE